MEIPDTAGIGVNTSARNPAWSQDELILALDLYFRMSPQIGNTDHPAIIELSELLNRLPIHFGRAYQASFRNPTGVYMKLNNFRAIDPGHDGRGLSHGSKSDIDVWNEFAHDQSTLRQTAEAIRAFVSTTNSTTKQLSEDSAEDFSAREGAVLLRQHKVRERNQDLVRKKKEAAMKAEGLLRCEACSFVFLEFYGELGGDYIECHHLTPLAQLRPGQPTRLSDLALLCANCHRMIHQGGRVRSLMEIRSAIESAKITTSDVSVRQRP